MSENIHPIFNNILDRNEREKFLKQKSLVIWMTGLSGSGKSTIAQHLEKKLFENRFFAQVLDGDNIRTGISGNLSFSELDRKENIRRIAEVSKLYINSGIICINSFISPTRATRKMAQEIIGQDNYFEVFINTSLETCEKRDVKGLYKKARKGEIKNFTGLDAPYEAPENPNLEIRTEDHSIEQSVQQIYESILPLIKHN